MAKDFSNYQSVNVVQTATITNGTAISSVINCAGATPLKLFVPSNFVASNLTFYGSPDGNTWSSNAMKEMANGTDVITVIGVVANDLIALDANLFAGLQYIKIATSATQNNGDVVFTVVGAPVFDAQNVG